MCGIAGVFSDNKTQSKLFIDSALNQLKQRGPDDFGVYVDELVSLGMTRLEILDPVGGKQPMAFSDRFILVYNGQIYNHLELRAKLPEYLWKSHSDTETLLVLLVTYGHSILNELQGMYSFALWDRRELKLLLARDPSGEKPLFFANENHKLWFASSIDALKKSISTKLEIDHNAVSAMLNTGFIPPSNSVFKNISTLKAGHYLIYDGTKLEITSFDETNLTSNNNGTSSDFLSVLSSAVQKQSVADVKVGLFLSGGLDSSLLGYILHRHIGTYDCFTAKLHNNSRDLQAASAMADKLGLKHHQIEVKDSDIESLLTKQSAFFDEPFGDSAAISLIAMSEVAKEFVGVCLSGDGADELFAGYEWKFRPFTQSDARLQKMVPRFLNRSLTQFMRMISKNELAQLFATTANQQLYSKTKGELFTAYLSRNYINQKYINPDWSNLVSFEQELAHLKLTPLDQVLEFERLFYLNGDILVKTDRATMGTSLEARTPFLDPMVINFAKISSARSKISWKESKIIVRDAYKKETNSEYVTRAKQGLGGPVAHWLEIPVVKNRLIGLQSDPFAKSLNEVFGDVNLNRAMNSNSQFKWNYLNLLLWAEMRGIRG
jgi:asparagine synthase (glutamine-hydrolysing)